MSSNKDEATAAFLAKKVAAGEALTEAQKAALEAAGGAEAVGAPEPEPEPTLPQFQAYVSGLPKATTSEGGLADLQKVASGVVGFIAITDRTTSECRGFGFATLESQDALDALVAALNGKAGLGSDELTVSVANKVLAPRPKPPPAVVVTTPRSWPPPGRKKRPPRAKKTPPADASAEGGDKNGDKKDGSFRRRRGKSAPKHPPTTSKKGPPKEPKEPKAPTPEA